jgi:hypothetical protein
LQSAHFSTLRLRRRLSAFQLSLPFASCPLTFCETASGQRL